MKYLALLRGINVGGNNLIKKDDLKKCFEDAGFQSVLTYIQSGNILFKSDNTSKKTVTTSIEKALEKKLGKPISTLVFTEKEYRETIKSAHKGWGKNTEQKHNALFLLDESGVKDFQDLIPEIQTKLETTSIGQGAIFWSIDKEMYGKSVYTQKLVKNSVYKKVTIRNSNTSFKLLDLFEKI